MSTYVGVDGGATHARAVVIDEHGTELARAAGGAGIVDPREPCDAAEVVTALVKDALAQAGVSLRASTLCCGLAGAGREQEREAVRVALMIADIADRVIVVGDAETAMADAFGDGAGVLLIAGTGSIAWARNEAGEIARVGGWGLLLGDEGSGYDVGLSALRAVARAADGRQPATLLTAPVLALTQVLTPQDLIAWAAAASKRDIAALTRIVLQCAAQHDAAAIAIRHSTVAALVDLAATAATTTGMRAPTIAMSGGLLSARSALRTHVAEAMAQRLPDATMVDREVDAALGAAKIAQQSPRG